MRVPLPFRLCGSVASSRLTQLHASLLELPGRPHGHCPECQLPWLSSLRQQLPCCLPHIVASAASVRGLGRLNFPRASLTGRSGNVYKRRIQAITRLERPLNRVGRRKLVAGRWAVTGSGAQMSSGVSERPGHVSSTPEASPGRACRLESAPPPAGAYHTFELWPKKGIRLSPSSLTALVARK
jgi:hypothetical protein